MNSNSLSHRLSFQIVRFFAIGVCCLVARAAHAAAPLFQYEGDGLTVRVLAYQDDGSVTGELAKDGKSYAFKGEISFEDKVEIVKGTFRASDVDYAFASRQREGEETLVLTTDGVEYKLREINPSETPAADPPSPSNAPASPREAAAVPKSDRSAVLPDQLKFRKVEFRDINMNNVVAYTMLVPADWKEEGHIEWSQEKTPYPQRRIKVTAPDKSQILFLPAMTFGYSEITPLAKRESAASGLPQIIPDQSGEAPPEHLGEWLVERIRKVDKTVANVSLVEDKRDEAAEAAVARQSRELGSNTSSDWQIHLIKIAFEIDGVPFSQEISLTYAKNPVTETRNINMWNWMLFTNSSVRAPADKFEAMKPLLYASANSCRSVPKWWTQQQQLIMEITKQNHIIGMEEIRRRGQFYDQMSDASFSAWKKEQAGSDGQQNDRINTINEVSDFKDTDGLNVKLPIHYQNYYSDGKGNYLMTNSTNVEPISDWTRLEPVK